MTDSLLQTLEIRRLTPGIYQPRRHFSQDTLCELAESIKAHGLIEPIVVRESSDGQFEIIAGERRYRASQIAELTHVPCIIRVISPSDAAAIALIENIQREDLTTLEVSEYLSNFQHLFRNISEFAVNIGKTRTWLSNALRLNNLHPSTKAAIKNKQISDTHGRTLLRVRSDLQPLFTRETIENQWTDKELNRAIDRHESVTQKTRSKQKDIHVSKIEEELTERFGSEVRLALSTRKSGSITIPFYSKDELEGLCRLLDKKC